MLDFLPQSGGIGPTVDAHLDRFAWRRDRFQIKTRRSQRIGRNMPGSRDDSDEPVQFYPAGGCFKDPSNQNAQIPVAFKPRQFEVLGVGGRPVEVPFFQLAPVPAIGTMGNPELRLMLE